VLTNIISVKFKKEGKVYSFDACDHILYKNDQVLVSTDNGVALGVVVSDVSRCAPDQLSHNLKKVLRKATAEDLSVLEERELLEKDAKKYCIEKIREKNLAMKLITVESFFDRSKMIFYFTADARVDFRELVKDLVAKFKTRIELKQIGARQETRIVKGLAVCGRPVCCAGVLQNLDRVTVKMAKDQSMSLNPEKISGLCGRLMCCLSFEHEVYAEAKKTTREIKAAPSGEAVPRPGQQKTAGEAKKSATPPKEQ